MYYEIKTIRLQIIGSIKYISIEVKNYLLGSPPEKFIVRLLDEYKRELYQIEALIDNQDFNNWSNDDRYIAEVVCKNLGIELI